MRTPPKSLVTTLLLLVILFSGGVIWLNLLARGADTNNFNQRWRPRLIHSRLARAVIGLHDVGDKRYDYLRSKNIHILIVTMAGLEVPSSVATQLARQISSVTGIPTSLGKVSAIPYAETTSAVGRSEMAKKYSHLNAQPGGVDVFIVSRDELHPTRLGLTWQDRGIIIFADALKDFTATSPTTYPVYLNSTLLHEFGHLLGLDHNDLPGCLMQTYADETHTAQMSTNDIIVNFCPTELQEIQSVKARGK